MVNFEWFRTFKAIYQTGTLTGAAHELLISQPNVSQHLASLEAYICHPLFERQPRRMVPTDYGKLLYTEIVDAVEKLENVEMDFRNTCAREVPLTCVGAPKEFFQAVIARRISQSAANFIFEFGDAKQLLEKVIRGDMYFTLTTVCGQEKNILYEPVLEERQVLVGNAGLDDTIFRKAIRKNDRMAAEAWLSEQTWYSYSSDIPAVRRFWQENFNKRPQIKPRFVIPDYDGILKALAAGNGLTIVADYLVKDLLHKKELKQLWTDAQAPCQTIYLAYDKTRVTTPQVKQVKALLHL
ncbi:LysR family transcriptional regulator [Chitinophaga oryzae]|uniref:LysR family transcriptional regulator n=1 Tax=Chitinophaga oryzae TaxID=2725414 RepID=A0AAE6ZDF3_9BACT|nr:LysR family transcriptional regulator [Chitinophaga oryzae]QJB30731.1 LysR family transcriptional regulator [Chitinophaga oryzae]QJB37228.1 LysR family transcriptional regulator [Chitinophaga oryzae]